MIDAPVHDETLPVVGATAARGVNSVTKHLAPDAIAKHRSAAAGRLHAKQLAVAGRGVLREIAERIADRAPQQVVATREQGARWSKAGRRGKLKLIAILPVGFGQGDRANEDSAG